jgi:hypothetical protein
MAAPSERAPIESGRCSPNTVTKVGRGSPRFGDGTFQLTSIYDEGLPWPGGRALDPAGPLRLWAPDELVDLAESAGLEVETMAGDYGLEPLGPGADRAILDRDPSIASMAVGSMARSEGVVRVTRLGTLAGDGQQ